MKWIIMVLAVCLLTLPWTNATLNEAEAAAVMTRGREVLGHEWDTYIELANVMRLTKEQDFRIEFNQTADLLIKQTRDEIKSLNESSQQQLDYLNSAIPQAEDSLKNTSSALQSKKKQLADLQADSTELSPLLSQLNDLNTQFAAAQSITLESLPCDDAGTAQALYNAVWDLMKVKEVAVRGDFKKMEFDWRSFQTRVSKPRWNPGQDNLKGSYNYAKYLLEKCYKMGLDHIKYISDRSNSLMSKFDRLNSIYSSEGWTYNLINRGEYRNAKDGLNDEINNADWILDQLKSYAVGNWNQYSQKQSLQAQIEAKSAEIESLRAKGTQSSSAIEALKTIISTTEDIYIPEQTKNIETMKAQRTSLQTETPKQIATKNEAIDLVEKLKEVMASKYADVVKTGYNYDVISNIKK